MRTPSKNDNEILEAALIGYQHMRDEVERKIAELRGRIGAQPASRQMPSGAIPGKPAPKRILSAAARRRIAMAQKRRWAAYKKEHGTKAAPKRAKRVLSAAGRARIVAATKKRWAEFRKAKEQGK
jgi:hypothetical protein